MERIFVYGAGGHAKVVIDIVREQRLFEIAFLVDDDAAKIGGCICGYGILGGRDELLRLSEIFRVKRGLVAMGDNDARTETVAWLTVNDFGLASAIHPAATVADGVDLGEGSVVMAGAVINPGVTVGRSAIINTGAIVDHDCSIGDGAHIAPGATLCGSVEVGEKALVGARAVVVQGVSIGRNAVVGAGSTVIDDVPDDSIVAGVPARAISATHARTL